MRLFGISIPNKKLGDLITLIQHTETVIQFMEETEMQFIHIQTEDTQGTTAVFEIDAKK